MYGSKLLDNALVGRVSASSSALIHTLWDRPKREIMLLDRPRCFWTFLEARTARFISPSDTPQSINSATFATRESLSRVAGLREHALDRSYSSSETSSCTLSYAQSRDIGAPISQSGWSPSVCS